MTVKDTSGDRSIPLEERVKPCDACGREARHVGYCGAWVCDHCEKHVGLARCYCGWSERGGDGRRELEELGENIGDDYD